MLLTKKSLNKIIADWRYYASPELLKELQEQFGSPVNDDEGCVHEYTEQDIYEQLRKRLPQGSFSKEVPPALQ